jgi:phosphohistidine swiveling domain-containing protein
MALDCARFAARRHGQELQRDDALDAAQDVFMFTVPEVLRGLAGVEDVKDVAAQRAATRARYQKMKLPDRWVGMPTPLAQTEAPEWAQPGDKIEGVSITRGIVEGFARVATTLDVAEDLEDDEILVCEVTDPSWVALFPLVAGMVVDIGGPLSHAAIVAREMGIPCVVNTKNAVSRIVTGMRIRLDATNGIVEVVDSAHKPAVEAGH